MPKIAADTLDEHVRLQAGRVLDAASQLFREQGFRKTDMGQIAARVGLARNSLYRYYPNKEHVLAACVQRDMEPFVARVAALEGSHPDPQDRVIAWVGMALDMALSPAHASMETMKEVKESSTELRQQIMYLHTLPNVVLEKAVKAAIGSQGRDPVLLTAMIAGMVQAAAGQAIRRGNGSETRRELDLAVVRLLQG